MPLGAVALMLAVNLVWSFNTIVVKIAVDTFGVPPLFFAGIRTLLILLVLFPLLRPVPANVWRVMAVGLAITGGSFALLFVGLVQAAPATAGIVSLMGAPLTVLFAILILKEKVRWRRGLGIALAFAGVLIAVASPSGAQSLDGVGYIALGSVVGALGTVFVKRLEVSAIRLQAWGAAASAALLLPLSVLLEEGQVAAFTAAPLEVGLALLYAALIVSVGAHTIYYRLLQRHEANLLVPLTLFTPIFTIALGAWITNDPVGDWLVAGAAVAIAGVAVILLRPSQTFSRRFLVRTRL